MAIKVKFTVQCVMPSRVTSDSGALCTLSIWMVKSSGMLVSPKIMTWHFSGFIFIELALNHEMIGEHCISVDNLASITDPQHLYSVLSSAKLQRLSSSIRSNKSLLKMFNKRPQNWVLWNTYYHFKPVTERVINFHSLLSIGQIAVE